MEDGPGPYAPVDCRERFKNARIKAGLSLFSGADVIALSEQDVPGIAAFLEDLETDPNEATMASVWLISQVCKIYSASPQYLYTGQVHPIEVTYDDVRSRLRALTNVSGQSVETLSSTLGWDISTFVSGNLEDSCKNAPVDMIRSIASLLNLNWVDILTAIHEELSKS